MSVTDHYAVLGLAFGASFEEIKKAHKKMALKHHPDKNVGSVSASGKFMQIQKAFEALESRRSDVLNRGGFYTAFAQQAQAKSFAELFAKQQRRTAAGKLLEEVRERKNVLLNCLQSNNVKKMQLNFSKKYVNANLLLRNWNMSNANKLLSSVSANSVKRLSREKVSSAQRKLRVCFVQNKKIVNVLPRNSARTRTTCSANCHRAARTRGCR
jgi:curved DNA-binding protein CbpA